MPRKVAILFKVTNSSKQNIIKSNNGLIFHVFYNNKYHQFCIHKRQKKTLNLVCCDRSCPATLVIKCEFLVEIGIRNSRRIFDIDPSKDRDFLRNVENWGEAFHECSRHCARMCKFEHKDSCRKSSSRPTWIARDLSTEIKKLRKTDEAAQPRQLASIVADAAAKALLPTPEPADGRYQAQIDERSLRSIVYNINKNSTVPTTTSGIPEQLINLPLTTDEDGNPVFEKFIHETDDFVAFILASDLRLLNNQAIYSDGTFEACQNLKYGTPTAQQMYQFVVKFEYENRTFSCILGQFLMKNRQTNIYKKIFHFLINLYSSTFPNDPVQFSPPAFHCDYEQAFSSAVRQTFPTAKVIFCAFHFSQTQHRRLSLVKNNPTSDEILDEVWTGIKSCPYLDWTPELVEQLFVQLGYMGTHLDTDHCRQKFNDYLDYLHANYFNQSQFSFVGSDIFDYFLNINDDITNNPCESKNYSLNMHFNKGRKTLASVCQTITEFKKKHHTERLYALKSSDKRYFRKRDPKLIKRFETRRQIVRSFINLSPFDQRQNLWSTMLQIGQLGPSLQ